VDSSVTIWIPSCFSRAPSAAIAGIEAVIGQTVLSRLPGRAGSGVRVHTIPVALATSTAATRSKTRSRSSSANTCGLTTATSYAHTDGTAGCPGAWSGMKPKILTGALKAA
jgi:hypothetical protein